MSRRLSCPIPRSATGSVSATCSAAASGALATGCGSRSTSWSATAERSSGPSASTSRARRRRPRRRHRPLSGGGRSHRHADSLRDSLSRPGPHRGGGRRIRPLDGCGCGHPLPGVRDGEKLELGNVTVWVRPGALGHRPCRWRAVAAADGEGTRARARRGQGRRSCPSRNRRPGSPSEARSHRRLNVKRLRFEPGLPTFRCGPEDQPACRPSAACPPGSRDVRRCSQRPRSAA